MPTIGCRARALVRDSAQPKDTVAVLAFENMSPDPENEYFADGIAEAEARCYEAAGREFNIGSVKQLREVLFSELGLPVIKKTKTGASTNEQVLTELAIQHPLPRRTGRPGRPGIP